MLEQAIMQFNFEFKGIIRRPDLESKYYHNIVLHVIYSVDTRLKLLCNWAQMTDRQLLLNKTGEKKCSFTDCESSPIKINQQFDM